MSWIVLQLSSAHQPYDNPARTVPLCHTIFIFDRNECLPSTQGGHQRFSQAQGPINLLLIHDEARHMRGPCSSSMEMTIFSTFEHTNGIVRALNRVPQLDDFSRKLARRNRLLLSEGRTLWWHYVLFRSYNKMVGEVFQNCHECSYWVTTCIHATTATNLPVWRLDNHQSSVRLCGKDSTQTDLLFFTTSIMCVYVYNSTRKQSVYLCHYLLLGCPIAHDFHQLQFWISSDRFAPAMLQSMHRAYSHHCLIQF